ncbi:hypothetical protein E4U17_007931 [Claviceps sp. LM77 group G4]|nr:hypothetical protein E4U17_007931 [Claviceps sp. LM77 group G4]KAG6073804.1 hypothetical protein E4U16_004421 [Claviceps sp. LM84 group G4]KAG6079764.1 hypothetical protein E4U33_008152 [Claviceps sp. LM78 group G4]
MSGNRTVEIIPDSKGPAVTGGSIRGGRGPRKWWQLGGEDVSHLPIDPDDGLFSSRSSLEEASKQQSKTESRPVAPEAHEVYKPVDGFEGAHRFDPAAKWTDEEEQALVRKVCFPMNRLSSLNNVLGIDSISM